jgi:Phage tail fibre repeat
MAKSYLTDINLNNNVLLNAKIQAWGSTPTGTTNPNGSGTAVAGQLSSYAGALYIFNGTAWVQVGNALSDSTSTTSSTTGASSTAVKAAYDLANAALPKNGGSMTGAIDLGSTDGITGYKITGLKNPSNAQDAATKSYVDGIASGVNAHDAVKYATTNALGLNTGTSLIGGTISKTYSNGTSGVGATLTVATSSNWTAITIDGQSLTVGDRVLIKDETSSITGAGANVANGIYTVTQVGTVGTTTSFIFTRAADNNETPELGQGDLTYVIAGTNNGGNGFIQTSVVSAVGTSPVTWSQFSGASSTLAGLGLVTNGTNPNQIDIGTASSSRIVVNADNIDLALVNPTTTGTAGTGTVVQSQTIDTYGRVTATTYAAVPFTALATSTSTATSTAASGTVTSARRVTGAGIGSGTSIVVNHGLGQWVHAQLFTATTNPTGTAGALVEVDIVNTATSSGTTTFTFASSQTLTDFQYVIVG